MKKQQYQLKRVSALTKHDKIFYYIDDKRVSKQVYWQLSSQGIAECLQIAVDGDKVTQLKIVKVG